MFDDIDAQILTMVEQNARIANADIAADGNGPVGYPGMEGRESFPPGYD